MSVIQFPSRRPIVPPMPDIDEELKAAQLDLMRAQLAQIQSETRMSGALWLSYCLRRVLFWGLVLWLLTTFAGAA